MRLKNVPYRETWSPISNDFLSNAPRQTEIYLWKILKLNENTYTSQNTHAWKNTGEKKCIYYKIQEILLK